MDKEKGIAIVHITIFNRARPASATLIASCQFPQLQAGSFMILGYFMKADYTVRQLIYLRQLNCREELMCQPIYPVYYACITNITENVDRISYFSFPT